MFTPLITHDSDGTALAAPVDAARRNGATYKTRTIDDLRIKDDRLRAAIEGTGHLLFDGGMGTMLQAAGMKAGALPELLNFEEPQVIIELVSIFGDMSIAGTVGLTCAIFLAAYGGYFLVTYLMSAGMVQAAIATRYSE